MLHLAYSPLTRRFFLWVAAVTLAQAAWLMLVSVGYVAPEHHRLSRES